MHIHAKLRKSAPAKRAMMATFAKFICYAVFLVLPALVSCATSKIPGVGHVIQSAVDAHDLFGAVTVVATKDKIIDCEAACLANLETKEPMRPDSLFWIASMTRPFTAVALLMLQDEGKLNVADPVAKYIPEFAGLKTPSSRLANITIAQMMTHTSGLGEASNKDMASAHAGGSHPAICRFTDAIRARDAMEIYSIRLQYSRSHRGNCQRHDI